MHLAALVCRLLRSIPKTAASGALKSESSVRSSSLVGAEAHVPHPRPWHGPLRIFRNELLEGLQATLSPRRHALAALRSLGDRGAKAHPARAVVLKVLCSIPLVQLNFYAKMPVRPLRTYEEPRSAEHCHGTAMQCLAVQ